MPHLRRPSTVLFAAALSAAALSAGCPPEERPHGAPSASAAPVRYVQLKWREDERKAAIAAGAVVIKKHECTRCHTIDRLPAAGKSFHCTSCHEWLKGLGPGNRTFESLTKKWGADIVGRYQRNIQHLQKVPDLTRIAERVRTDWLVKYLSEPWDLRPNLEETMIRHQLTAVEVKTVVRYFAAEADADDPFAPSYRPPELGAKPSPERIAEGKAAFLEKGCAACHTFGNVDTKTPLDTFAKGGLPAALAPNLRFARERTRPDVLVQWVMDPKTVAKGTLMPMLSVDQSTAEKIRDFLFWADPELKSPPPDVEPELPKTLDREVAYEEMKERTLGKVCVHCHMNDYEKDTGPGNHGGMGYAARGLKMRTYETLVAGAVGADGKRYSVLQPRKGEKLPPILQVMLDRRREHRRDFVPPFGDYERPSFPKLATPGMPLGLPAMTDEEIAILATWIAQGCKGPTAVSGRAGVDDGFLVPDGPIAANKGCELREPDAKRPAWAVDHETVGKVRPSKDHDDHEPKK